MLNEREEFLSYIKFPEYTSKAFFTSETTVLPLPSIFTEAIKSVNFIGGCPGNLIGISSLVKGMNVEEAIQKLKGIPCRTKETSCPDQLAKAIRSALEN